jgi:hypothetical protein
MAHNNFRRGSAIAAIAAALLLASVTSGSAQWYGPWGTAVVGDGVLGAPVVSNASYYDYGGIYDYAGVDDHAFGLAASEIYHSRNGTPFGPPDPATCGGYSC